MDTRENIEKVALLFRKYKEEKTFTKKIDVINTGVRFFRGLIVSGEFQLGQEDEDKDEILAEYSVFLRESFHELLELILNDLKNVSDSDSYSLDTVTKYFLMLSNTKNLFDTNCAWKIKNHETNYFQAICDKLNVIISFDSTHAKKQKLSAEVLLMLTCFFIENEQFTSCIFYDLVNDRVDLKFMVLRCLFVLLTILESGIDKSEAVYYLKPLFENGSSSIARKMLKFTKNFDFFKIDKKVLKERSNYFVQSSTLIKPESFKMVLETFWLKFCHFAVNDGTVLVDLIPYVTEKVLVNLYNPILLSDFYSSCFGSSLKSTNAIITVLSLEGLFELITRFGLDYPSFYEKLYHLCKLNLDTSQPRVVFKFFFLLDKCLTSEYLATSLVCSFMKALGRKSITSDIVCTMLCVIVIHNIFIRHPTCISLLHKPKKQLTFTSDKEKFSARAEETNDIRKSSMELAALINGIEKKAETNFEVDLSSFLENDKGDPVKDKRFPETYNTKESNPLKTGAENSFLWEVYVLNDHFSLSVRRFVDRIIFKEFTKSLKLKRFEPIIDIRLYKELSLRNLFQRELNSKRRLEAEDTEANSRKRFRAPLKVYSNQFKPEDFLKESLIRI